MLRQSFFKIWCVLLSRSHTTLLRMGPPGGMRPSEESVWRRRPYCR